MRNPVRAIAKDMTYGDKPSLLAYLGVTVWLSIMVLAVGMLIALIGIGIVTGLPWSLIPTGVFLVILSFGWYTWYRDQNPKVKRVRLKK